MSIFETFESWLFERQVGTKQASDFESHPATLTMGHLKRCCDLRFYPVCGPVQKVQEGQFRQSNMLQGCWTSSKHAWTSPFERPTLRNYLGYAWFMAWLFHYIDVHRSSNSVPPTNISVQKTQSNGCTSVSIWCLQAISFWTFNGWKDGAIEIHWVCKNNTVWWQQHIYTEKIAGIKHLFITSAFICFYWHLLQFTAVCIRFIWEMHIYIYICKHII